MSSHCRSLRSDHLPMLGLLAVALATLLPACSGRSSAGRQTDPATALYDRGDYAAALPLLTQAAAKGPHTGILMYQVGYCRDVVQHDAAAKKEAWGEAETLLEKEVAAPGGATLERLYYLMRLKADHGDNAAMAQYARQGIEQYEKGPNPNALTGEDWFRLGRLHEFLQEPSEAEAAYRRSVSDFKKRPGTNPIYHALALLRVADDDLQAAHYDAAVTGFEEALALGVKGVEVPPYRHALALLGAGRFEQAADRFAADRDAATMSEAQYGADLARKAQACGPFDAADREAEAAQSTSDAALVARIREAGKAFRAARQKYSYKPGDALSPELTQAQRQFVILMRERMLRDKTIQDFCLQEGIADLVRR
jgi:hypothetical protein